MPTIKTIHICYEDGLDWLAPHMKEALEEVMNCFPEHKDKYPIKVLGNWYNGDGDHDSVAWYIASAQKRAIQEGVFQRTGQISTDQYIKDLISDPWAKKIPQWQILVTKKDLYANGVNWCLGHSEENLGAIVSTARFNRRGEFALEEFKTVLMREFGHVIGLTNEYRENTESNFGPHCTNEGCIMQQRVDGDFSYLTRFRLEAKRLYGFPPICEDCVEEGNKFFDRQQMAYNFTHGLDLYQGVVGLKREGKH